MSFSGKATIISILRASIHDGPGIRTTVFFKGCPLRCGWCHNPESWSSEPQLFFNRDKCVDCMACVGVCPTGAHQIEQDRHMVKFGLCIACGKCVEACYYEALSIFGQKLYVEAIFDEVKSDMDFYTMSGGGVTLSGGEPMLQPEAASELLKKCREAGIHTCIETCGYAPEKNYKKILPYVDTFLFDYKDTDSARHKKLTGVSNELILSNLDFLYKKNARIILRCPLIPSVNDTENHLKGIAELSKKYPLLEGIEIMPYHNLGISKGTGIGLEGRQLMLENTSRQTKDEWSCILKKFGCTNFKMN